MNAFEQELLEKKLNTLSSQELSNIKAHAKKADNNDNNSATQIKNWLAGLGLAITATFSLKKAYSLILRK